MTDRLPPEFLAALQSGAPPGGPPGMPPPGGLPPPGGPPGPVGTPIAQFPPGAAIDAAALGLAGPEMGGMPPPTDPGMGGLPPDMGQIPPALPPGPPQPAQNDQILGQMLAAAPPLAYRPPKKRIMKVPKPDLDDIFAFAQQDKRFYTRRNNRFARDTEIFRQWQSGVPSTFDEIEDVRWIGSAMSNLVNRMANLMGGLEVYVEAPYKDDQGESSAQKIEDFLYNCLDYERRVYAQGGGASIQRDKFFYLFLRGWLTGRILPDLEDEDYPFNSAILDPATCYPIWGSDKGGMTRMTRQYTQTASELVADYAVFNKKLIGDILGSLDSGGDKALPEFLTKTFTVIEYWDQEYRGVVTSDGIEILAVKAHDLGSVPFVMIPAIGEPKGFQSPDSASGYMDAVYGPLPTGNSDDMDQAQKGVSVMHYLINTHRLGEALNTLLYAEVEKAADPATIRYRAAQLMGQDLPEVDYRRGGTNEAMMGLEKLEGLPTSPHPTDVSPLKQSLDQDWVGGAIAMPGAGGLDVGAQSSGYSLDVLIASAKELVLPYLQAYENFEMLVFEKKLEQARDVVLPLMSLSAPETSLYGANAGIHTITSQDIEAVGTTVKVRVKNINEQNRPALTQSVVQQMQAGLISQKYGMDQVGIKNPNKMFAEILAEKAIQHPQVMDMFSIPSALQYMGAEDLANFWLQVVVQPQIMQMQAQQQQGMAAPPGQAPPGMPPGAPPGGAPNQGGQPEPPQPGTPPGGPLPGQGRGPEAGPPAF